MPSERLDLLKRRWWKMARAVLGEHFAFFFPRQEAKRILCRYVRGHRPVGGLGQLRGGWTCARCGYECPVVTYAPPRNPPPPPSGAGGRP